MTFFNRRKLLSLGIVLTILLAGLRITAPASAQTNPGGKLRFVHTIPGASAIDITVDKALAAHDLAYGTATRYLNVPAGDHTISVTSGGTSIFDGKVTVSPTQAQTILVQGTASAVELGAYEDDLSPVAAGKMRFTAINAVKDAPALDLIRLEGNPLIQGLKYGEPHGAFDIPVAGMGFAFVPAGGDISGALVKTPVLSLMGGTTNMLVILGTVSGDVKPSYLLLNAATDADTPANSTLVRFVHAVKDAPAVDLYVGDNLYIPSFNFGDASPHIALPSGSAVVSVRAAGSDSASKALMTANLTLTGGKAMTLVITGTAAALTSKSVDDNISTLSPTTGRVQIINAGDTGSVTVKLTSGSTANALIADATKPAPQVSEMGAGIYDVSASLDSSTTPYTTTLPLSGGVLYDIIAVGTDNVDTLIVAATGLNEQPGSAPAPASSVAVAASPASATEAATEAAVASTEQPTLAEAASATPTTEAAPAATQEAVQTEQAPAPTETPAPPANPPTATSAGIVAVANTNEGVNLKIREYPSTTAKTLALVPSGSSMDVLGVRGPAANTTGKPSATPSFTPTPTGTLEDTNADFAGIWLYISWTTSDGGTVKGWVNAQFVKITNNGKLILKPADTLAFKQIPEDTPGEINSTAVTPVAASNQIMGVVNVDPNVNLQIRRQPSITAESLSLLPSGAQVVVISKTDVQATPVVGAPSSPTWFFIEFDSDSGKVFGWVNSQYIKLTRNNAAVDISLVPVATDITVGYVQGTVSTGASTPNTGLIATVDKVDPGANLQFRRTPDATSESLGLIPSGTQLEVLGRNGDGTWIEAKYNDQVGWVSINFVTVTKNGHPVKMTDLKNVSDQPDTILTPTVKPLASATAKP